MWSILRVGRTKLWLTAICAQTPKLNSSMELWLLFPRAPKIHLKQRSCPTNIHRKMKKNTQMINYHWMWSPKNALLYSTEPIDWTEWNAIEIKSFLTSGSYVNRWTLLPRYSDSVKVREHVKHVYSNFSRLLWEKRAVMKNSITIHEEWALSVASYLT